MYFSFQGDGKAPLLEGSTIMVDRTELRRYLSRARNKGKGAGIFLLKKVILLAFTTEELANSGGQGIGISAKSGRVPLADSKCQECKGEMPVIIKLCSIYKLLELPFSELGVAYEPAST